MRVFLIFIFLVSNIVAFEIKKDNTKQEVIYELTEGKYITEKGNFFDDETYIMVRFNEETPSLISEFESKYNLELQKVMVIGFYIYKSESNPIDIIPKLIDEENVNSVKPKWKRVKKRR